MKKIIKNTRLIKDRFYNELFKFNSFNENAFYIQSTINQSLQKISEKSLIDNLALFERKYKTEWKL